MQIFHKKAFVFFLDDLRLNSPLCGIAGLIEFQRCRIPGFPYLPPDRGQRRSGCGDGQVEFLLRQPDRVRPGDTDLQLPGGRLPVRGVTQPVRRRGLRQDPGGLGLLVGRRHHRQASQHKSFPHSRYRSCSASSLMCNGELRRLFCQYVILDFFFESDHCNLFFDRKPPERDGTTPDDRRCAIKSARQKSISLLNKHIDSKMQHQEPTRL